jgi:hypothetical protein
VIEIICSLLLSILLAASLLPLRPASMHCVDGGADTAATQTQPLRGPAAWWRCSRFPALTITARSPICAYRIRSSNHLRCWRGESCQSSYHKHRVGPNPIRETGGFARKWQTSVRGAYGAGRVPIHRFSTTTPLPAKCKLIDLEARSADCESQM